MEKYSMDSMDKKEFLRTIQSFRRRLNIADFLKKSVLALSVGAGAGILFQTVAFITPFYYVNLYTALALFFAELAALVVLFARRTTMKQAALVMDRFGFEERIVTACENWEQDGDLIELQRRDAMEQLHAHKDRIRIPLLPSWKKIVLPLGLFVLLSGLALVPSVTKDRARELHGIKKEVREKEKEIEEVVKALEHLEQEELTPEQKAALREMAESLRSSMSEYQQTNSQEMMTAAMERLNYKYENISREMADLLRSGAVFPTVAAEAMQEMSDELWKMSGREFAMNGASDPQQGQNGGGNGQNGQGNGGQNGNGQNGQGNDGQNGNGQSGQGNGGQNGNGQNGQGNDGQNGTGSGNGTGDNGGNGRGTGSSSTPHDYVSVPNAIADSGNLAGNAANHDASEYFRAQNGISWEGEHVSYDAVIGSYEQNAYEGIAAGRYPSGMEEVIKEYFSSF